MNHKWSSITMFGLGEQASPISEGVAEIWINIHLASDKPDNTTHVSPKTSRVATVYDNDQRVKPGPHYPSKRLPRDTALRAIRGWPMHYPFYYPRGIVGYRPTQWPTKLLSLRDSINPVCVNTKSMLVHLDPTNVSLNRHKRGYHLGAPNLWSRPLILLPI
jgi:hypothetical protein